MNPSTSRKSIPTASHTISAVNKANAHAMLPAHSVALLEKGYRICLDARRTITKRKVGAITRYYIEG